MTPNPLFPDDMTNQGQQYSAGQYNGNWAHSMEQRQPYTPVGMNNQGYHSVNWDPSVGQRESYTPIFAHSE